MVYASIKEVWGVDELHSGSPMVNPYVVKDPVQNQANFKKFRRNNFGNMNTNRVMENRDSNDESYDESSKKYKNNDDETRYFRQSHRDLDNWCEPNYSKRYFTDEDEYSDVTSDEITRKVVGKRLNVSKPKSILKRDNVHEGFEGNGKRVDCVNMLGHLKHCKVCRAEFDDYSKNVFIREFIIFAGCGILMFLFLDLLRKISAQRK
jgi:hypothetical protein